MYIDWRFYDYPPEEAVTPAQSSVEKKLFWKKTWFLVLAGIVILGVIAQAFGGGNTSTSSTSTSTSSATSTEESTTSTKEAETKAADSKNETVSLGQEFTAGDWGVTVVSVGEPVSQVGNEFLNT